MESSARQPAAVSASKAGVARPRGVPGIVLPIAGPYEGSTDERFPRAVEFRFLGSGIRDLIVDGRMVAQWVPVGGDTARAVVRGAEIRLTWVGPRDVRGTVLRRRRGQTEIARFTAAHRFRGLLR